MRRTVRASAGFTLIELVIVIALMGVLITGLLSTLTVVYLNTQKTEIGASQRFQYDKVVTYVTNTIRRNAVTGAIEPYGDGTFQNGISPRLRVKIQGKNEYIHYYLTQEISVQTGLPGVMLRVTVSNADTLTGPPPDGESMILAIGMPEISFQITQVNTGSAINEILEMTCRLAADTDGDGVENYSVDRTHKFNLYTS